MSRGPKKGQIAHIDQDSSNSAVDNLCWLCLAHHDEYDSSTSQSKGITPAELRQHRADLHRFLDAERSQMSAPAAVSMSTEAIALANYLSNRSQTGRRLDSRARIETLSRELAMDRDDVEIAIDELANAGLVELSGTRTEVYVTNRFFWETDPLFEETDPVSDAGEVARVLVRHGGNQIEMDELASLLGWGPRRLNPATTFLVNAGIIDGVATTAAPFWTVALFLKASTKRFVRDLDRGLGTFPTLI